MSEYSFVKMVVPKDKYEEKREFDGLTIALLDAVENGEVYECVECSVPTPKYDAEEMVKAYKKWKERMEYIRIKQAKRQKIAEIEAYDQSDAVNGFILNGVHRWLPIDKRQSIAYSAEALKKEGHDSITIWFDTDSVVMPLDKALDLLGKIEVYAKTTNNVTHQHKADVESLTSILMVEAFDAKAGYPDKVKYTF